MGRKDRRAAQPVAPIPNAPRDEAARVLTHLYGSARVKVRGNHDFAATFS
jgi:hypothetical protein